MPGTTFRPTQLNDLAVDVSLTSAARGDVLYRGATKWNNLAAGTSGKFLQTQGAGADPIWATVSASPAGSSGQVQYNSSGSFAGAAAVTYSASGSLLTSAAQSATDVPLTSKGAASQSGDLQRWTSNVPVTLSKVTSAGCFRGPDGISSAVAFGSLNSDATGMYFPGGNQLGFSSNGSTILYASSAFAFGASFTIRDDVDTAYTTCTITSRSKGSFDADGGDIFLLGGQAGSGGTGNHPGGTVYLLGGAKAGTSANGRVVLLYNGTTARGNLAVGGAGSFGGGELVVYIANATTNPSTNPTGGGILYVDAGALKYRGSSGTTTTIAPA